MTIVRRSALVPFSAEQMFDLVSDIPAYPKFLPWCRTSQVLSADADMVRASIEIAHGSLSKAFTTRNRLQRGKMIEMRLETGPFRHLEGYWRFDPLGDTGCRVSLDMEFEFANRIISLALGPIFNHITTTLVDSFTKRAHEIYGKG